jgi:hypothetical protein
MLRELQLIAEIDNLLVINAIFVCMVARIRKRQTVAEKKAGKYPSPLPPDPSSLVFAVFSFFFLSFPETP